MVTFVTLMIIVLIIYIFMSEETVPYVNSYSCQDGRLQMGDHILQVNDLKCHNMSQRETKEAVIPELRNSTPTVFSLATLVFPFLRLAVGIQIVYFIILRYSYLT